MVKSFFHRYFSFSNKVFYPVAYIMNELQHLTTPTGLKFYLALCFSSGPQLLKIWPQLSPGWLQLFSFGERDGDNFFRARANPERLYSHNERLFGYYNINLTWNTCCLTIYVYQHPNFRHPNSYQLCILKSVLRSYQLGVSQ